MKYVFLRMDEEKERVIVGGMISVSCAFLEFSHWVLFPGSGVKRGF